MPPSASVRSSARGMGGAPEDHSSIPPPIYPPTYPASPPSQKPNVCQPLRPQFFLQSCFRLFFPAL